MKYIYGPINSRRLGLSLGLSLTPHKTCNLDCLYCQLGKTKELAGERREYVRAEEILDELKSWIQENPDSAKRIQFITISGSGEPTLNIKIAEIINEIRKICVSSIAVITNATLLGDAEVRNALMSADLIVPSLDAVSPQIFKKVNRPHERIKIENIINGLISLRKEFRGKIWLEVMLVKGVNDDLRQIRRLKEITEKINPDKIQLNSPVRTTAEEGVFPVDKKKLGKIKGILGENCEII